MIIALPRHPRRRYLICAPCPGLIFVQLPDVTCLYMQTLWIHTRMQLLRHTHTHTGTPVPVQQFSPTVSIMRTIPILLQQLTGAAGR